MFFKKLTIKCFISGGLEITIFGRYILGNVYEKLILLYVSLDLRSFWVNSHLACLYRKKLVKYYKMQYLFMRRRKKQH